jgi:hypothetical protein
MSVGYQVSKSELDQNSGTLARQINGWAESAVSLQSYLAGAPDADLEALGYTPEEVALLKSAVTDMNKLAQVFLGATEQTPAYDFRTFINRLGGLML